MFALLALVFALNGAEPVGGVTDGGDALYGATATGGPHCIPASISDWQNKGCGVVYRVSYDGSVYTIIHAFDGTDGRAPEGSLQLGADGLLYGRTASGGPKDAGVIYSVQRDGSHFRVLDDAAKSTVDDPPLAITAAGDVYAVNIEGTEEALTRYGAGQAQAVAVFPAGARAIDLRALHDAAYVLLTYEGKCGSEIRRFDAAGGTGIFNGIFAISSQGCETATYLTRIFPASDLEFFAISNEGLHRVEAGKADLIFSTTRRRPGYVHATGSPVAIFGTRGGRILVSVSPDLNLNCGTVLSIGADGDARAESIFPDDPQFNDVVGCIGYDPVLTVRPNGAVYGTSPGYACETTEHAGSPLGCGSVFAVVRGVERTVHAFAPALRYESGALPPSPRFFETFQTTADPHRFLLTRTTDSDARLAFAAQTPSPLAAALKSILKKDVVPMVPEGPTLARAVYRAFGPLVPALAYRVPSVPAGMYDLTIAVNGEFSSQIYFPEYPTVPRAVRDGQKFLALAGLLSPRHFDAMTDAQGRSLDTSPIVLLSHDAGKVRFRVSDSGEILNVPGSYLTADSIPGLTLTVDDDIARRLRSDLVGKTVYPRALAGICVQPSGDFTNMTFLNGTLRVRNVYRLSGVAPTLSIDGSGGDYAAFSAIDPLVITFETPVRSRQTIASGDGSTMTSDSRDCSGFYVLAADPWHVRRMLFLHPSVDHSWPAAFRKAVELHTVLLGMTRAMVAASIGYPPVYGNPEDFEKIDDWKYDAPPPSGQEVLFSAGQVVKYDAPGIMP